MTDLIVGGGAVGTFLASALAAGGRDVAIVRRRLDGPPRTATITLIERDGSRRTQAVTEIATPSDLPAPPDLIVFSVKLFDLAEAVASCAAWPHATSLTPLNGVGAEEIVLDGRPDAGLIAGSLTVALDLQAGAAVAHLNRGGIGLAAVQGVVEAEIDGLVAALEAGGLAASRYGAWRAMKWSKLVANLVGNASSAIVDLPPEAVYADPAGFEVERRQLLEILAVMRRLRLAPVSLPGVDVRLLAAAVRLPAAIGRPILRRVVAAGRGGKDPSLRIQARSGPGPSEVGWLNGAVARVATELGGEARVNRRLAALVEEVLADPGRRAWFQGRPDRLAAAVQEA
ncbi:MAG TPA: ketopantoate reductase C-terminal domain-containing protein [Candidatus Limnocylindrales bacterium]|nr:ketopantoate reductase C-terminal domain-containing protein [Candidatus Limnocylindrales bacterium]